MAVRIQSGIGVCPQHYTAVVDHPCVGAIALDGNVIVSVCEGVDMHPVLRGAVSVSCRTACHRLFCNVRDGDMPVCADHSIPTGAGENFRSTHVSVTDAGALIELWPVLPPCVMIESASARDAPDVRDPVEAVHRIGSQTAGTQEGAFVAESVRGCAGDGMRSGAGAGEIKEAAAGRGGESQCGRGGDAADEIDGAGSDPSAGQAAAGGEHYGIPHLSSVGRCRGHQIRCRGERGRSGQNCDTPRIRESILRAQRAASASGHREPLRVQVSIRIILWDLVGIRGSIAARGISQQRSGRLSSNTSNQAN